MIEVSVPHFELLSEILALKELPLRSTYSTAQAAEVFGVSKRALQNWMAQDKLPARDLPGRARFLPSDLEACLQNSLRKRK